MGRTLLRAMEGEDRYFEGWHEWKGTRRVQSLSESIIRESHVTGWVDES